MSNKKDSGNSLLRRYPLTIVCVALVWYLCLIRTPSLRMHTFHGFDKCVHVCMYLGTCSVFWVEYFRSRRSLSRLFLFLIAVAAPIVMSGLIELAQEYFTAYRSGDWADFAANSAGVLTAWALSPLYARMVKKWWR